MKCRGKINVKGKGSMITYFLHKKKGEDDVLPHQGSKTTAASSDDYELVEEPDEIVTAADCDRLQQKRKSLCRQHHIFSSLNNNPSTISMTSDDSIDLIDPNGPLDFQTSDRANLLENNKNGSCCGINSIVSPENHGKILRNDFRPNLPLHCNKLMDSIESLQKLLKNDISLSDLTAKNNNKISLESNDGSIISSRVVNNLANDIAKMNGDEDESVTSPLLSSSNENYCLESMEKDFIKNTKFTLPRPLKVSKSLYPIAREQYSIARITNSKSMCAISTHH